ncbi:MAG TPA: methylenetetrahydrofolate reductase [NAD(P)H] [Spirochaetota bacterium]|nr:methylenetetrahydrofolate reductase [NAD(P)H] [Spirochaetota bacterium]
MRLIDRYKKGFTISFEIFPPKTPQGEINLWKELVELSALKPGYISVTYGAGGSTREKTLDIALKVRDSHEIEPLVHFTCVGADREEIAAYLKIVKEKNLENILALRGDPPQGQKSFTPPSGGFSHANELVGFVRKTGDFCIAVAGYPEGHIEAESLEADIDNLRKKIDAGADFIITQLFYDNADYYNFMNLTARRGISVPVIPGIMPVTSLSQITRITGMCGAKIPEKLMDDLHGCESEESICRAGTDYSIRQCAELKSWGVPGFHFYTLNKSDTVKRIIQSI